MRGGADLNAASARPVPGGNDDHVAAACSCRFVQDGPRAKNQQGPPCGWTQQQTTRCTRERRAAKKAAELRRGNDRRSHGARCSAVDPVPDGSIEDEEAGLLRERENTHIWRTVFVACVCFTCVRVCLCVILCVCVHFLKDIIPTTLHVPCHYISHIPHTHTHKLTRTETLAVL
jgi:hypothetical protein